MQIKRTSAQIKARYEQVSQRLLDFQGSDLLPYMDYEDAKPFLKEGVTAEQLSEARDSLGSPLEEALKYLPFAWEKANNCRGLSAGRSVDHLKAWLWLAGYNVDGDFDRRYEYYGKPCLVTASALCDFDWRAHDDMKWRNDEMGRPISEGTRDALVVEATNAARRHREEAKAIHAEV
jgi:hypothetical protein